MDKTTILIVEDEAIVAEDLAMKVRKLGYHVAGIAAEGEEAIKLTDIHQPDLLLMDIRIEGDMDGIETAKAIQNRHDIPILYLTAHSDDATLKQAKLTRPFGYISKPFWDQDLAIQIELALYKHRSEREINQQREWLRITLNSIGDAVIAVDDKAHITFINPTAEVLTGWKSIEAVGRLVSDVLHLVDEQSGELMEEPLTYALYKKRSLFKHIALATKDGRTIPIENSAAPILSSLGKVLGTVLVFRDVTENRRAVKALEKYRNELEQRVQEKTSQLTVVNEIYKHQSEVIQSILDNIPVMICLYDASGKMQLASKEIERRIGWTAEDMITGRFDLIEDCFPDPVYRQAFRSHMVSPSPDWLDFAMKTRSGKTIEISWAGVWLSDGSQIGIGIDITYRKAINEKLKNYAEKLEQSNLALQEFTTIAAHDLNEPLRKVNTFGRLLKQQAGQQMDALSLDYLDRMLGATGRMQTLLNSLLEYSRVTTHTEMFRTVDLQEIIKGVLLDLEPRISITNAEVSVDLLPAISAEPTQMRQLFQNLISNALKFCKPDVRPLVHIRHAIDNKGNIRISVEDNGIGFDETYRNKLFAPFQRLHGRDAYEGTGMGLAICKKIMERHKGNITAKSTPGKGSVFSVILQQA